MIIPLQNYVLIKEITPSEKIGDIIVPMGVDQEPTNQGIIISIGKKVSIPIKKDDVVLLKKYGFDEINFEGRKYLLGKEDNILAIIK